MARPDYATLPDGCEHCIARSRPAAFGQCNHEYLAKGFLRQRHLAQEYLLARVTVLPPRRCGNSTNSHPTTLCPRSTIPLALPSMRGRSCRCLASQTDGRGRATCDVVPPPKGWRNGKSDRTGRRDQRTRSSQSQRGDCLRRYADRRLGGKRPGILPSIRSLARTIPGGWLGTPAARTRVDVFLFLTRGPPLHQAPELLDSLIAPDSS
jgi:hypothetical protein